MERFDAVVIGAGAAGMFCAAMAGQAGRRVLLLDNGKKPGRKILMSGGGRCNFTNLYVEPAAYLSQNRHFCKSALARYTQWDFIELVGKHGIAWHEKTLGQLFCDDSAQQIVDMLVAECEKGGVVMRLRTEVLDVARDEQGYTLQLNGETVSADNLVIASGGLSMPGLGASPFGYKIAEQFGLKVLPTRAGLVPFTLHKPLLEQLQTLSGVSVPSVITAEDGTVFRENLLFTHRGLSGPAVLQISSYWQPGGVCLRKPGAGLRSGRLPQRATRRAPESKPEKYPGDAVAEASRGVLAGVRANSGCCAQAAQQPRAGNAGGDADELARTAKRHRRLPHGGSDAGRRGYKRTLIPHDGSPQRAGSLFHW